MSKYFIVWNEGRTEGFVTNDEDDAGFVSSGFRANPGVSTAGEAFREVYADEDEDEGDTELEIQEIEL